MNIFLKIKPIHSNKRNIKPRPVLLFSILKKNPWKSRPRHRREETFFYLKKNHNYKTAFSLTKCRVTVDDLNPSGKKKINRNKKTTAHEDVMKKMGKLCFTRKEQEKKREGKKKQKKPSVAYVRISKPTDARVTRTVIGRERKRARLQMVSVALQSRDLNALVTKSKLIGGFVFIRRRHWGLTVFTAESQRKERSTHSPSLPAEYFWSIFLIILSIFSSNFEYLF